MRESIPDFSGHKRSFPIGLEFPGRQYYGLGVVIQHRQANIAALGAAVRLDLHDPAQTLHDAIQV